MYVQLIILLLKKYFALGVIGLLEPINPFSLPDYNMDSFNLAVDLIR